MQNTNHPKSREEYAKICVQQNRDFLKSVSKSSVQIIKNKHGLNSGVIISFVDALGNSKVGYSQCNLKAEKFDRAIGINKALKRALEVTEISELVALKSPVIPHSLIRPISEKLKESLST